jgi:hypothetical protein
MLWNFNDIQNMKDFAKFLSSELQRIGESKWSEEVSFFSSNTFATSSEYFGEFRIVLVELVGNKGISFSNDLKDNIDLAIKSINRAFGQ